MNPHPYAFLALFVAAAVAFPVILLLVAQLWFRVFQPPKPGAIKNDVYECGVAPTGDSWIQFKAHYYLYAILFLIFDVETIFLLPWAIIFMGDDFSFTKFALLEMFVFIAILVVGYYYAWRKGALEWA